MNVVYMCVSECVTVLVVVNYKHIFKAFCRLLFKLPSPKAKLVITVVVVIAVLVVVVVLVIVVDVVVIVGVCVVILLLFGSFSSLPAVAAAPCHRRQVHWACGSDGADGTDAVVLVHPEL